MVSCSAARERLRAEPRCALCIRVRGQAFNDGVFVDKVPRLKAKRRAHQIVRPARHEERESREREIGGIKPHKGINREFGARTQNSSTAFSVLAESRSSAEGSSAARGEPPAIARASSGFLSFWTSKKRAPPHDRASARAPAESGSESSAAHHRAFQPSAPKSALLEAPPWI